jgi:hypothetical protein
MLADDRTVWSTRSDPPDPIYAAIASHQAAARALDGDLKSKELASLEEYAANDVVSTLPTTLAGLDALGNHLSKDRSIFCLLIIRDCFLEAQPNGRNERHTSEFY